MLDNRPTRILSVPKLISRLYCVQTLVKPAAILRLYSGCPPTVPASSLTDQPIYKDSNSSQLMAIIPRLSQRAQRTDEGKMSLMEGIYGFKKD